MHTPLRITVRSFATLSVLLGLCGHAIAQEHGGRAAHLQAQSDGAPVTGTLVLNLHEEGTPSDEAPPHGVPPSEGDRGPCTPDALTLLNNGCAPNDQGGSSPTVLVIFHINGPCYVGNLCWTINGGPLNCNFIGAGNDIPDGGSVILTGLESNSQYVFYFTTAGGTSENFSYTTGNCDPDPCLPVSLIATANGCTEVDSVLLPTIRLTFSMDGGCAAQTLCWTEGSGSEECLDLVDAGIILHNGDFYDFIGAAQNTDYVFHFTTADGTSQTISFTTGDCANAGCVPQGLTFENAPCVDYSGVLYATILMTFAIDGDCEVEDFCYTVNGETNCANLPDLDIHLGDGDQLYLDHSLPNSTYTITFTTAGGTSETYTWNTPECFDCFPQSLQITHYMCQGTELEIINVRFNIDGDCYAEDLCWTVDGGAVECLNLPGFETYVYDNDTWQFGNWDGPVTYQFYFTTEGGQSNNYTYHGHDCDPTDDAVEEHALGDVSIFIDPVQDLLSIRAELSQRYELTLLDQLGRTVVQAGFNGNRTDVPMAHLATGVYSVVLATGDARLVQRVVKP